MLHSEVPCLMDRSGEIVQVRSFAICIGAQIQNGEKVIELVQHTPKRDKGPQMTPRPTHVRAGGDLNQNTSATNPNVVTFERRRAAQQYYQVHVDLFAELDSGEQVLVAKSYSAPLVVRGRSPGHYADTDEGAPCAAHQISGRYYRNDSISSNGGGPIGAAAGEYPYYSGYGYGSTYQYQSLGSASHIAAQSPPEGGYYERSDMESYPGSPMSPVGPSHPGALDAPQTHHAHPYMTPQVPPGFVSEPVSPDMYNASGFTTPGAESPSSSYGRFPQTHPHAQNGHYPYTPPYSQYPQAQDHQEQDHETQMAGLRIHSPISPSSPGVPTPRRQSFSSSLKKNERASFSGPSSTARKTRSISMSGVTKRAPSSTRSSRTVPVTPTRDLGMGLGITNDRIPEAPMEEHLA
ncbi:hypothetical protein BGW38_007194 [Lunasporangiospora selenospora]|uniref:NDT80 domain-containing protein n=1 Tax=Lunasporangiospora selenospora TaxID=979761 RepID=A0A9P6FZD1_9FUNG|nr:hypothetical protein BGW38_007194 [Lunasporangiospora selenospora]